MSVTVTYDQFGNILFYPVVVPDEHHRVPHPGAAPFDQDVQKGVVYERRW